MFFVSCIPYSKIEIIVTSRSLALVNLNASPAQVQHLHRQPAQVWLTVIYPYSEVQQAMMVDEEGIQAHKYLAALQARIACDGGSSGLTLYTYYQLGLQSSSSQLAFFAFSGLVTT